MCYEFCGAHTHGGAYFWNFTVTCFSVIINLLICQLLVEYWWEH